jgi:DNA mismatch repair protein MutS
MIKSATAETETPLMKQYNTFKAKYPDAILLFRVGDFYETFSTDARTASAVLGIVLTKRSNGKATEVELAGFPHHSLDTYLPKLVRAGYKVAVCDQLEDPKLAKGIVKRGVTEMVTPGVVTGDNILSTKANNFLASLYFDKDKFGAAFVDISTGEFLIAEGNFAYVEKIMQSLSPSEVLYPRSRQKEFIERFGNKLVTARLDDWVYTREHAYDTLLKLFETNSLKGFGIEEEEIAIIAAGAAIQYLKDTEHHNLSHIARLTKIAESNYVWLDRFTIRNLELIYSPHQDGKTLLDIIDRTVSPMGARLLKRWIVMPLVDLTAIHERIDAVEFFTGPQTSPQTPKGGFNTDASAAVKVPFGDLGAATTDLGAAVKAPFGDLGAGAEELKKLLRQMGDMERLISKVSLEKANPREISQLKRGLLVLEPIKEALAKSGHPSLSKLADKISILPGLTDRIAHVLRDEAGPMISKGNFINDGVDTDLDELRLIKHSGKEYIAGIQTKEVARTGISSLKIGFNNVFGYYLEVTNTHKSKVPNDWIRKQTLANAERYITEELKEYESKVLGAEDKIQTLEERLFAELVRYVKEFTLTIQQNAQSAAYLDCLLSLAEVALSNGYTKPDVNDSHTIYIKDGRHPVIEKQLDVSDKYVPNDVYLDDTQQQILMITGPNMSGKSALLRQTALIVLMSQIGSYVPATAASIGFVDKIFTRVGASDNLSAGESTFMVEMNETAGIMNNLTPRCLILLDEIGRGTSTYDGISIAWSLAEFLHNYPVAHPRTLFATHYHELNELADKYERIKNFHVTTKEVGNKVIFLRKLAPGGSEHSFGIHVARIAGMPRLIVDRAGEILLELESKRVTNDIKDTMKSMKANNFQMSIFDMSDPKLKEIAAALEKLEINALTPIEALMKLHELKKMME